MAKLTSHGTLSIDWVYIPAGPFVKGIPEELRKSLPKWWQVGNVEEETRLQTVDLPAFYISRFPVTWWQFMTFQEAVPPRYEREGLRYASMLADHPIYLTPNDALLFCEWIGARPPTSSEWEKAARGTDQRMYPWGNDWSLEYGNFGQVAPRGKRGGVNTVPVNTYPEGASPYGLYDTISQGYEWTSTTALERDDDPIVRGSTTDIDALWPELHYVTNAQRLSTLGSASIKLRPALDEEDFANWRPPENW